MTTLLLSRAQDTMQLDSRGCLSHRVPASVPVGWDTWLVPPLLDMSAKSLDTVACLLAQHARALAPQPSHGLDVVHVENFDDLLALDKVDVILADPAIDDTWTATRAEQIVDAFAHQAEIIFLAAPPIDLEQLDRRFRAKGIKTFDSARVTSDDIRSIIEGALASRRLSSNPDQPL